MVNMDVLKMSEIDRAIIAQCGKGTTECDEVINCATIRYRAFLNSGFSKIKVRCIPAKRILSQFIQDQKESIDYLNLEK